MKLRTLIEDYSGNLAALREFVEFTGPVLQERERASMESDAANLLPLALAFAQISPELSLTPEQEQKIQAVFGAEVSVVVKEDEKGKKSVSLEVSGDRASDFDEAMTRLAKVNRQTNLLYRSALISLVSMAEWFLSRLIHSYFAEYPDAIGAKENVFSLEDLRAFESIEDARGYLIDRRVENVLRGSLEDWITFLKEKMKLSMGYLEDERNQLMEHFQRRNLLVHNGGIVNAIFG